MKCTFNVLFFIKKTALKKNGKAPIMCRVTENGKIANFSMKLEVEPKLWNASAGRVNGQSFDALSINKSLDQCRASINKSFFDSQETGNPLSAEMLKNNFLGFDTQNNTLVKLFRKHNDNYKKLINISTTRGTYLQYEMTLRRLQEFMKFRYRISDILLADMKYSFIKDFDNYLRVQCGYCNNYTAKFIKQLKLIFNIARNNGDVNHNPFANHKVSYEKVDRGYLTEEELKIIMEHPISVKRLQPVRDIFIFSCFCGLAYIDLKNLTQDNIRTAFDDSLWIMTKRHKTNIDVNVKLLDVPLKILEKYSNQKKLLPTMSHQKVNEYLKEIGELCGINKKLTFHLARHTFSTFILTKGVPIESVSKMLGHTSIKTTQIYARIIDKKVGLDMDALSQKIGNMKMFET